MILVSACLCGVNCKYNGKNNLNEEMLELLANASYKNVAFLDELIQYCYKYIEDNNKELNR